MLDTKWSTSQGRWINLPHGVDHYIFESYEDKFPPVLTKVDFVKRYSAGEFGNRSPTWDSYDEWRLVYGETWTDDLFHLRNRVAGGITKYDVPQNRMWREYEEMQSQGVKTSDIYVSTMCPTHLTQIQGEVTRLPQGLYLYYSTVKKPMRASLLEGGREAVGLKAKMLLQYNFDPGSYEWMETLLDRYPDHVLEFTCLSRNWGVVPQRNVLWWECRKY